jgi:transporter family-2 protein
MAYVYLFLAFLTGLAVTVQAGVNANLRQAMANPVLAAAISFGTGFLSLVLLLLAVGGNMPSPSLIKQTDWWKWTGGVIGAMYVTTVIISVPKIGTANLVSLSVAGQLVAAVVLDHYGWLGFTLHPANSWRLLGVAFIMVGVMLVVKN